MLPSLDTHPKSTALNFDLVLTLEILFTASFCKHNPVLFLVSTLLFILYPGLVNNPGSTGF